MKTIQKMLMTAAPVMLALFLYDSAGLSAQAGKIRVRVNALLKRSA